MTNGEKEEIIELTEVVEESSSYTERGNAETSGRPNHERREEEGSQEEAASSPSEAMPSLITPPTPEEKPVPETERNTCQEVSRPAEPPPLCEDYESEVRALREALNARAERWLGTEGVQVLNQGVREMIPRIAEEEMEKEIEKFKAEVEKIRTLQEALSAKVEKWLDSEGLQVLNQGVREMIPAIAKEVLEKEAERLQEELEGIRVHKEALNTRAEKWLAAEGLQVLDQRAREMMPRIAAEAFGKEIEKLQAEVEKMQAQKEALQMKTEEWMASDGMRVLERVAREMFPLIATEVLRQEIEKLKVDAEEKV
ncbi:MAG: hypothetical protein OEW45_04610 [Deltaproteobacteria bacterium]|nr:hypothetical protein [Deltaproteobacteria bacterium]